MSQKCLIIEDDSYMAEQVKEVLQQNFPQLELLGVAPQLETARKMIDSDKPDLVISDINLEDKVVFELFSSYDQIDFKIIFITSFSKYAVQAFRFSALDFLEKPFEDEDLIVAVNKAIAVFDKEQYNKQLQTFFHNMQPHQPKKKLVIKNLEAVHIVDIEGILYVKSDNNYSEFHLDDGRKLVASKSLKLYDDQLRPFSFFRSHQSYLLNIQFAKTFHKQDSMLELLNGEQVPVAGSKTQALLAKLESLS